MFRTQATAKENADFSPKSRHLYEMREISYCVTCGQDMTGWSNAQLIEHSDYHLDRGESDQWRSEGRQVKVGEHQEIDYYICSCGATKAP